MLRLNAMKENIMAFTLVILIESVLGRGRSVACTLRGQPSRDRTSRGKNPSSADSRRSSCQLLAK